MGKRAAGIAGVFLLVIGSRACCPGINRKKEAEVAYVFAARNGSVMV